MLILFWVVEDSKTQNLIATAKFYAKVEIKYFSITPLAYNRTILEYST